MKIMDIESKIMLGFLFAFIAGIFIGWYVTWQKYHLEEEKRQAVEAHIAKERIKKLPMTEREKFFNLINQLNDIDVNEFRIVYGDDVFVKNPSTKPTDGKFKWSWEDAITLRLDRIIELLERQPRIMPYSRPVEPRQPLYDTKEIYCDTAIRTEGGEDEPTQ